EYFFCSTFESNLADVIHVVKTSRDKAATTIGICYGRVANNLPPPAAAVNLINTNGITSIRLFNPVPESLQPFSGTGIQLTIGVPNEELPALAAGTPATANDWLQANIFAHVSADQIRYINNPQLVSLDSALFRPGNVLNDQGLVYDNLFDQTIDAFIYAMEREGFGGIPVVVTETGWPTAGVEVASGENAFFV
nr:glucan endo-1,3-beta-glucosidase-like [Tanacetum cinerariifolium]